jgi:DNA-binding beta-propeller fold protein YncE
MNLLNLHIGLLAGVLCTLSPLSAVTHAEGPAGATQYRLEKTLQVGGDGRWDYAMFDPSSHRLYVTRSTHTQAIDVSDGKVVADIAPQKHSHGTAIVPSVGRGFITDGGDASIVVFDLKTGEILGKVPAADDADGIIYDAGSNRLLIACGDAKKLLILAPDADPKNGKCEVVELDGSPEFLAADGKGRAFVNINDKKQVAVIDINNRKVTGTWSIGTGAKPTGLAIDPEHGRLFVGCRSQKLVVLDTQNGHVLAELPIGQTNDACAFNPTTGEAFASCGDGTLTVVKEISPGKFDSSIVATKAGAKTMALDPKTGDIFLPTAEFAATSPQAKRPAVKPNSFMILVVAPAAVK